MTKVVDRYIELPQGITKAVAHPEVPDEPLTYAEGNLLGFKWRAVAIEYEKKMATIRNLQEEGGERE